MTKNQIHDLYFQYFGVSFLSDKTFLPNDVFITFAQASDDYEKQGAKRIEIKKRCITCIKRRNKK
jgi:hypothetical protein